MKAMLTCGRGAILGFVLAVAAVGQGADAAPEQQSPKQLVKALAGKDWKARNRAAATLLQQANDLDAPTQRQLWRLVAKDVGFFESRDYDEMHVYGWPDDAGGEFRPVGYYRIPEVSVPKSAMDLVVPYRRQVLALLVLQSITAPAPGTMSNCMAVAEKETDPVANQMALAALANYGKAAADRMRERLSPAATGLLGGKALVSVLRLLPQLGEPGWSVLHDAATDADRALLRQAAMRVIGISKRDVEVDLFVARRLFADKEAAAAACGALVKLPASDEDPTLATWLVKRFARSNRDDRLRIVSMLAMAQLRGRAAQVATAFLVRALLSDEKSIAAIALVGIGRRSKAGMMQRHPDLEPTLIRLARGGDSLAIDATQQLREFAGEDDALMARLLDAEVLAIGGCRTTLARYPSLPKAVGKRLDEELVKAAYHGDGKSQLRLARAFVAKPWWQVLPDAVDLIRAELQSEDARHLAWVAPMVGSSPELFQPLRERMLALTQSEDRDVRHAGWRGLVILDPKKLPFAIRSGYLGTWDTFLQGLAGRAPRSQLVALFDHKSDDVAATAVMFLAGDPAAIPDLIAGLRHESPVVRKHCAERLPSRLTDAHQALLRREVERLRVQLADGNATWRQRMVAGRLLIELNQVRAPDTAVLAQLSSKLDLGSKPQVWQSYSPLDQGPPLPQPKRWELFTAIERLPVNEQSTAWLLRTADKDPSAELRAACRDLLQRFRYRRESVAVARAWFAADQAARESIELPDYSYSDRDTRALRPLLFDALRDVAHQQGRDTLPPLRPDDLRKALEPSTLSVGDYDFPYVLLVKGEKPANGWPLFLCMHGGGGNGKAEGPHAWRVNSREWQAQKTLFQRVYQPAGIYFIPRMADDRRGRWWHDHNQLAFEQIIEQCLLFRDVDPNRVYLMGISEGGYGAIRFAGNRPDRFAATGGMAAAEPIGTSPPENMRNVGVRIDIGEKDTMFDRVGLARRMGERLAELHALDPDGYDYSVNIQAGRGHGIDYSKTPTWLAERVRDPRPKRVVWTIRKFDSRIAKQHYWLSLGDEPNDLADGRPAYVDARIRRGQIDVTIERDSASGAGRRPATSGRLILRLDDRLVDLDYEVELTINGHHIFTKKLKRSLDVMLRTMAERSDPNGCFTAEIVVDLSKLPRR